MKFSTNSNTIIHKDQFDFMMKDLKREFDRVLHRELVINVAFSYLDLPNSVKNNLNPSYKPN